MPGPAKNDLLALANELGRVSDSILRGQLEGTAMTDNRSEFAANRSRFLGVLRCAWRTALRAVYELKVVGRLLVPGKNSQMDDVRVRISGWREFLGIAPR